LFVKAAKHYEHVVKHTGSFAQSEAVRIHQAYIESLAGSGAGDKAVSAAEDLMRLAGKDPDIISRVAELNFEHGPPERAQQLYSYLDAEYGEELDREQRAVVLYRIGECARKKGDFKIAKQQLREAADLEFESPLPLRSLTLVHQARREWAAAVQVMDEQLERESGEGRVDLLIEMGDLISSRLHDATYAAKTFLAALSERPDDRTILMKLMKLYSEGKDWTKLVAVILKIAGLVEEKPQKAKYLQTAAKVVARELGQPQRAAELLEQVVKLDPAASSALDEALDLRRELGDAEGVVRLLTERIRCASAAQDRSAMLSAMDELGHLYLEHFDRLDQAIAVNEGALEVEPESLARREYLASLYERDPVTYFEKAVEAQMDILRRDPYRPEAYRSLRGIYTKHKRPDATWCCCQALYVLNRSKPDETMFYKRMRFDEPAETDERISDADWWGVVVHPDAERLLTVLFALIQPSVSSIRAQPAEELGYSEGHEINPERDPYVMARVINYVGDVVGVEAPPLYQNTNDPGDVSLLHAHTPSLVLGRAALAVDAPTQDAAFAAARQIAYLRPGLYVRHLVPTSTGLKAWLFATIKLISPGFPIAPELEAPVHDALGALESGIAPQARDHLAEVVAKLLKQGALDLKKWVAAVDYTADRIGLILSQDLQVAVSQIRTTAQEAGSTPADDRIQEIFRYSASESYFGIRRRLGIAVDT
jgi:tetratricopeptide (TPR) repeat protein